MLSKKKPVTYEACFRTAEEGGQPCGMTTKGHILANLKQFKESKMKSPLTISKLKVFGVQKTKENSKSALRSASTTCTVYEISTEIYLLFANQTS